MPNGECPRASECPGPRRVRPTRTLALASLGLSLFAGSAPAQAATTFGGYGRAVLTRTVNGDTISCSVPVLARFVSDPAAGFALTHQVGPGTGSSVSCAYEAAGQGPHVASDRLPLAHRCDSGISTLSSSPYTLTVTGATHTAKRLDFDPCRQTEEIVDQITMVRDPRAMTFTRTFRRGPAGSPRFLLTIQGTLTPLDPPSARLG